MDLPKDTYWMLPGKGREPWTEKVQPDSVTWVQEVNGHQLTFKKFRFDIIVAAAPGLPLGPAAGYVFLVLDPAGDPADDSMLQLDQLITETITRGTPSNSDIKQRMTLTECE